jgi:segregation and condensation protein A
MTFFSCPGTMHTLSPQMITLDIFEGPIDFLVYLIQKNELNATEIPLHQIIIQYLDQQNLGSVSVLDCGADFISAASSLLWLKTRSLLPTTEQIIQEEENALDPKFDMVHHLVDYCRFKQAAIELSELEKQKNSTYCRGNEPLFDFKKKLGIEHLTLGDLASLFQQILSRAKDHPGYIQDENWKVSDKISLLRETLNQTDHLIFESLFLENMFRMEMIVIFLAVLELMKLGELCVIYDQNINKFLLKIP